MVAVHDEYTQEVLISWTRALWKANQVAQGASPETYPSLYKEGRPFEKVMVELPGRLQRLSEQGFDLSCYALALASMVLPIRGDHPPRTSTKPESLFDVWRRATLRNRMQSYFSGFEKTLHECLQHSGEDVALAAFPQDWDTGTVIDTLEYLQLEYKMLSQETLMGLLKKIEQNQKA